MISHRTFASFLVQLIVSVVWISIETNDQICCGASRLCKSDYLRSEMDWVRLLVEKEDGRSSKPDLFDISWTEVAHLGARNFTEPWYTSSGLPYTRAEAKAMLNYMAKQVLSNQELQLRNLPCEWLARMSELDRPIQVHIFGGSVTLGHQAISGLNWPNPDYSWVAKLQRILDLTLGKSLVQLHNFAGGGHDLRLNFEDALVWMKSAKTHQKPDLVIINTQTNDIRPGNLSSEEINAIGERAIRGLLTPNVSCIYPPPLVLLFEDTFYCKGIKNCPRYWYLHPKLAEDLNLDHSGVAHQYHVSSVQWPHFAAQRFESIPRYTDQYYIEMQDSDTRFAKAGTGSKHPASPVHYMMAMLLAKSLVVMQHKCCREKLGEKIASYQPWYENVTVSDSGHSYKQIPAAPVYLDLPQLLRYPEYSTQSTCGQLCTFQWNAEALESVGMTYREAQLMVVESDGWTYDGDHSKWGLRAVKENAKIRILLAADTFNDNNNNDNDNNNNKHQDGNIDLIVHYMTSYTSVWGQALVTVYPVLSEVNTKPLQAAAASLTEAIPVITNSITAGITGSELRRIIDTHDDVQQSVSVSAHFQVQFHWNVSAFEHQFSGALRGNSYIALSVELLTGATFKLNQITVCPQTWQR